MSLLGAGRLAWKGDEAISYYTEQKCIVRDCFFTAPAVPRNDRFLVRDAMFIASQCEK
jgi:hypothetical protein